MPWLFKVVQSELERGTSEAPKSLYGKNLHIIWWAVLAFKERAGILVAEMLWYLMRFLFLNPFTLSSRFMLKALDHFKPICVPDGISLLCILASSCAFGIKMHSRNWLHMRLRQLTHYLHRRTLPVHPHSQLLDRRSKQGLRSWLWSLPWAAMH